MTSKKYYYESYDKTIFIESPASVDILWININVGKHVKLINKKPKKITHKVIKPDRIIHWVNTIEKIN